MGLIFTSPEKRAYDLFHYERGLIYNLDDYRLVVTVVTSYLADLNHFMDLLDKGKTVKESIVKETLAKLDEAKNVLLRIKTQLGLDGGLDAFSSDLTLFGAEFRNGRFLPLNGHEALFKKETKTAADEIRDKFPENTSAFMYEAMTMVLFFCYPLASNANAVSNADNIILRLFGRRRRKNGN